MAPVLRIGRHTRKDRPGGKNASMDLGSVTLLEINRVPDRKRIAYCLPSGEFIFATTDSARCFSADWCAADLYGKNVCPFLAAHDVEKLEDYMRGHCSQHGVTLSAPSSSDLQVMVRVQPTGTPIWIRLRTIPLTLRLSRCIDAVRCLVDPVHLFADSSSFVISEEELSSVFLLNNNSSATAATRSSSSPPPLGVCVLSEEDVLGNDNPPSSEPMLPLELKESQRASCTPNRRDCYGEHLPSTTVPDASVDDTSLEDQSLANYAFEADWASEVLHQSLKRSSTDAKFRSALVI